MIQFRCPCGRDLQAREEHAGMQVTCPSCAAPLLVPGAPAHAIQPQYAPPPPAAPDRVRSPGPGYGGPPRPRSQAPALSGKALASLITGIGTFLIPVLLAIPAILLGILARRDVKKSGGRVTGGGLAIAGIACGLAGNLSLLPYWLVWTGIEDGRAKARTQNNLKQIGLAMHMHHDMQQALPAAAITDQQGKPLLSWRVAILPYLEQEGLYRQFRLDEPWDSPHNLALLPRMPEVYAPTRGSTPQPHSTYYQVFTGPQTPFPDLKRRMRLVDFFDGTSNTILVAEAGDAVPWTKPADLIVLDNAPLPPLSRQWGGGFHVAMADGSVRWVNGGRVSENTLRIVIGPRDGMITPPDWER